ncbi:GGDEF domain-containing protein [Sciscionella marina]|uniref:GGDEF domain-containing protein n=1 Tax=Sciscionella marina TaxID=508770 RepID=UPI00036E5AD5|nr:GGDEF domain-containing protein [Sciscionella marina]
MTASAHQPRLCSLRNWQLWRQRPLAIAWLLAVAGIALIVTVLGYVFLEPTGHDLIVFGALIALGVVQAEISRHVERTRRSINTVRHVDLTSVWTFAGILLLPPGLAYSVIIVLYLHLGLRSWLGAQPLFQQIHAPAAVLVTAPFAQWLFHLISPVPFTNLAEASTTVLAATAVAALAYSVVDMFIIAIAAAVLRGGDSFRTYVGDFTNHGLDLSTNCIGAFVALALVYQPFFVVFTIVPVLVIHRSVLVKELEEKAIRDQKTGLLNATAWNEYANQELARAERHGTSFGLLMVDLDFFKRTNDTYGHLAGDNVLIAVAEVLRNETRRYDSAGRFGGEEFAVLLPESNRNEVALVAERIRVRISQLTVETDSEQGHVRIDDLTASLGVAIYPGQGRTIDTLLQTADAALYSAKRNGRNQVVGVALPTIGEAGQEEDKRAS